MSHNTKSKAEFEKHLVAQYPNLYTDMNGDIRQTCMGWGITTGSGWYDLIDDLSAKLEALILKMPKTKRADVKMVQCKEQFGMLRIYMSSATDEMYDLIDKAEAASESICQGCGVVGTVYTNGWVRVHCQACETKYQQARQPKPEPDK